MILANRLRVLLADDNPAVLEIVSELLSEDFDIVGRLDDGACVVHDVQELHPDLVILDIGMPSVDGLTVAKSLSKLEHSPKIVFLTVYDEPEFVRAALDSGASGYVFKARLRPDLEKAIATVLAGGEFISRHCGQSGF